MIKIECPNTTMFRAAIRSHIDSLTEEAKANGTSLLTPGNDDHGVEPDHATSLAEFSESITTTMSNNLDVPAEMFAQEVPGLPGQLAEAPQNVTETTSAVDTGAACPLCPVTGEVLDVVGGYPWDARIHGKAKKTNSDGQWRLTQGIEKKHPGIVARTRAEFDAKRDAGDTPSTSMFADQPDAQSLAPPTSPSVAQLADMPDAPNFQNYLEYTTARVAVEPKYQTDIDTICKIFEFTSMSDVIQPGVTPEVFINFGKWLGHEWKKYA